MTTILVVDDEDKICLAFKHYLNSLGHEALVASNAADALELIRLKKPGIIFLDIRLPGMSGLDIVEDIRTIHPDGRLVMMTAHGSMDTAIDAMRKGAYEYLTKPIDLDKVGNLIQKIGHARKASSAYLQQGDLQTENTSSVTLVGRSTAIQEIYKMIGLLTTNDVPVLIEGESGVGKELVARAIHYKSKRANEPFVAINCGAMPDHLLESELFGHEKGAFTGADTLKIGKFEFARKGTIFLDEIGDLKFPLQIKLLRVLQEKQVERLGGLASIPVHARVVTATNKSLADEVRMGNFRSDLYYRLQLVSLIIPPLRNRKEDIPELTGHFINKANEELQRNIKGIQKAAVDDLIAYHWPGNIRELENTIKRAVILSRGDTIESHAIQFGETGQTKAPSLFDETATTQVIKDWFDQIRANNSYGIGRIYTEIISVVEKTLLIKALKECDDNQVRASDMLGISRSTLRKKMKDYNL